MFALDNFLKEHSEDWREILSNAPYNLTIKENNNYILFKYSQIESDFSLPEVCDARGSIYYNDEYRGMVCACRPFSKFFNLGEPHAAKINWTDKIEVTEKIDGSLIKCWRYKNKWHMSTNSNIDAFETYPNGIDYSFGDLVIDASEKYSNLWEKLEDTENNLTHMFELVSPLTKVVIPYELDLYYLGSRNIKTGEYKWDFELSNTYPMPKLFKFNNINEVVAAAAELDWMHEGFVVFDGKNRVKCKSGAYVVAHHAATKGYLSDKSLLNIILMNETSEFLVYCPEYADRVKELKEKMEMYGIYAKAQKTNAIEHLDGGRKEYALWVQKFCSFEFRDFLFKYFEDHDLTWEKYSKKLGQRGWERILCL